MCHIPIDYHELETLYGHMLNHSGRILGITASREGEGVTSMVRALGERLACDGQRVLLVDLNCENPSLTRPLKAQITERPIKDHLLDIMPLTRLRDDRDNFMQLKNVKWLRTCFEKYRQDYDWVLIDTSAVIHPSRKNVPAELILSCCDSAYLVVKAGITHRTELFDALNRLHNRGVNLLGTIYNDQENPTLAHELERETERLQRVLPKLTLWLKQRIKQSYALNMII